MESQSSRNDLIRHIIFQMIESTDLIITWNKSISNVNDYPVSPEGMQVMAASCMLIEAIGEGVKKIDRIRPGFIYEKSPDTPWKQIMGLRDHIAHGYFNLDADIIFDVVKNEIPELRKSLENILTLLDES